MDIEVLLHGVPNGQDYYGIKEERRVVENFYNNSSEESKFYIEIRKNGDQVYCYYTYLRYKGLVGHGGRPGSYFGLTLRMDEYYKDVNHIYNVLEIIFKKYVLGTLLTPVGTSYKYTTPDFASKKTEIEKIEKSLIQLIISTCVVSKFVKLDNSFVNQYSSLPSFNINEMDEENIILCLKKYSRIVASASYKTESEKQIDAKINDINSRQGGKIAEKEKIILEKETKIRSLEATISKRDNEIVSLNDKIRSFEHKGEISQLVSKIKEPITSLAKYFIVEETNVKEEPKNKFENKNFYLIILNTILVILLIILLLTVGGGKSSKVEESKEYISLQTSFNSLKQSFKDLEYKNKALESNNNDLQQECEKLKDENNSLLIRLDKKKADELKKQEEKRKAEEEKKRKAEEEKKRKAGQEKKAATQSPGQATSSSDSGGAAISTNTSSNETSINTEVEIIISPNVSEVVIGDEYSFSIKGYSGKGEWRVDGFTSPTDKTATSVKVKAKEGGTGGLATISFTPQDGTKKVRQFKYKLNE